MSTVKLAGALPPGTANGLAYIVDDLVQDPQGFHVALVVLDCSQTTVKTDTGEVVPTARVRRIMPILDADIPTAQRMLERAVEKHSGQTMLPFELEEDLAGAFSPRRGGNE